MNAGFESKQLLGSHLERPANPILMNYDKIKMLESGFHILNKQVVFQNVFFLQFNSGQTILTIKVKCPFNSGKGLQYLALRLLLFEYKKSCKK